MAGHNDRGGRVRLAFGGFDRCDIVRKEMADVWVDKFPPATAALYPERHDGTWDETVEPVPPECFLDEVPREEAPRG